MKVLKFITLIFIVFSVLSCHDSKKTPNERSIMESDDDNKLVFNHNLETKLLLSEMIIGSIDENNQFKFTSEEIKELVEKNYETTAQNDGFSVDFEDFDFIHEKDNNGYYMLTSRSEDIKTKTPISFGKNLRLQGNSSFVLDVSATSVSCTGCRRGCSPRRDSEGDGYCTDCKISNSNCTKTESIGGQ
ncbi:hypothetical protein [Ichthyenterobacterium magnum]|uniref:Uncharacterized protein n=1 Tax=Ichthyenterobacterium magnum TaxID=1230530 RepID=A0A420DXW9_9FLAO|nr:hypothetical protein [Ichthyenterobacterium magnum]RKE99046.1 hypothetical protein BXY80_1147 [Ichthyenterobacterium magnum]